LTAVGRPASVNLMTLSHKPLRGTVHSRDVRRRYAHLYAVSPRRFPRAQHVPPGRTLHLVDLENLMGGPWTGTHMLLQAIALYKAGASVVDGDHVVVAVNPALLPITKAAWPSPRVLSGRGPDGADLALLAWVNDDRFIAERYDQIIIGSGDGIFEEMVTRFRSHGLPVGVVSRGRSLSSGLANAATFVRLLPNLAPPEVAA